MVVEGGTVAEGGRRELGTVDALAGRAGLRQRPDPRSLSPFSGGRWGVTNSCSGNGGKPRRCTVGRWGPACCTLLQSPGESADPAVAKDAPLLDPIPDRLGVSWIDLLRSRRPPVAYGPPRLAAPGAEPRRRCREPLCNMRPQRPAHCLCCSTGAKERSSRSGSGRRINDRGGRDGSLRLPGSADARSNPALPCPLGWGASCCFRI